MNCSTCKNIKTVIGEKVAYNKCFEKDLIVFTPYKFSCSGHTAKIFSPIANSSNLFLKENLFTDTNKADE